MLLATPWINFSALEKIIVVGILAGAGLPALFAVGLRALDGTEVAAESGGRGAGAKLAGTAVAVVCFAVVLAAIGWGIYEIVHSS